MRAGSPRKRFAGLCLAIASAASLVAACSSSGGGGASSSGAGGTSPASASTGGGGLQALYAEAKKEGKVVLWGGEDPDEMQKYFTQFSKTYPGLKLKFTAVNPDQQPTQLQTAQAAGQSLPDIIQGRREFMPPIQNLVNTSINWSSYGVDPNIISADGGLVEIDSAYVLGYNKNLIKDPSALPKTWTALNSPTWKGKVSIDNRGFPFNILAVQLGEQGAVNYVKSFKSNVKPVIVQGATAGMVQLTAGAYPIRVAGLEDVKTQQAAGAPVGYSIIEPVLIQQTLWYLLKGSPDPAAGELFATWFTSAQGGQVMQNQLDHRTNQTPAEVAGKQTLTYTNPSQAATVAKATTDIAKLLGGGS